MSHWRTTEELNAFAVAFETASLPKQEWTHAAHVAIGALYILRYGASQALDRLRVGIRRLNEAHGLGNSDTHGYHESLTRFWVTLIARVLAELSRARPDATELQAVQTVVNELGKHAGLFRGYWTYDVAASVEARRRWIEPDAQRLNFEIDP